MLGRILSLGLLVVLLATSVGCIGVNKSGEVFLNSPAVGSSEVEMIMTYGAPMFTTQSGDQTVYVYRVVDSAYYILYGYNGDVDLVVVCEGGKVKEVKKVKATSGMALFQPNTWPVN